ncbi:ribonuclease H-like domain-containing protein [Falsibacillus pallidus]|uniref:ribonuclease H-like domain-containing protein n=1 Tax=Falsibacillus pallidus TaxID=493781 RepID=UPI003D98087A
MSLKNKLNRMKHHIVKEEKGNPPLVEEQKESNEKDIPFMDQWEKVNVIPYYFDGSYCLIREERYSLETKHGKYPFKDLFTAVNLWNDFGEGHPLSSFGHDASDLFFFDTETTGLGGGAGNTIFLLGYARVEGKELVLKQHILPQPGDEIPLYQSFLEKVDYTTLVTYNGKAFDWPQVKTRHTLIREHVPKLPSFGHFDLFHASRRMWKHKLDRVKLTDVEKEILDFHRVDDVPGFLAPMIYFDFVERKDPEGLIKILIHNEKDILSLVSLYIHLSFQILNADPKRSDQEALNVGKWFDYVGNKEKAFVSLKEASKKQAASAGEAKFHLAFYYKREKNYLKAYELWLEASKESDIWIQMESMIELAKIEEHQFRRLKPALEFTHSAMDTALKNKDHKKITAKKIESLQKRVDRLQKKIKKNDEE